MRRVVLLVSLVTLLAPSSASAAPSLLSVSPQRVNFGTKAVGTTTFKTITVTNTSSSSLIVSITGGLPDDFGWGPLSLEQDLCVFSGGEVLAPGDTCQIFVRFSPTEFFVQFGRQTGTLEVTASDPSTLAILQSTVIRITGTGR
jgi:Abnormal spindle-like microcephaly-assoc'd, ASPM-SPD-2-Hydin